VNLIKIVEKLIAQAEFEIKFRFKVKAITVFSEEIYIVGLHAELGKWEPKNAVKLSTNAESYPLWTSPDIVIKISGGIPFEYKYFKKTASGKINWELGANRKPHLELRDTLEEIRLEDEEFFDEIKNQEASVGLPIEKEKVTKVSYHDKQYFCCEFAYFISIKLVLSRSRQRKDRK